MKKHSRKLVIRVGAALAASMAAIVLASAGQTAYTLTIKNHQFEPAELKLPANQAATLVVKNLDSTPEEFESKPLRIEKVIPANSEAAFQVRALKPGRYKFVGEFHEDSAEGEIVVE